MQISRLRSEIQGFRVHKEGLTRLKILNISRSAISHASAGEESITLTSALSIWLRLYARLRAFPFTSTAGAGTGNTIKRLSCLVAGWAEHKISSEARFKGILKKCFILAFVGMAHLMGEYLFALGEAETARNVIALFYIANEGIAII